MRTNGQRIRAMEVVPVGRRAWMRDDLGFRRLFEYLDEHGPARAPRQERAAELALRSLTRFKRDFQVLSGRSWGEFRREWRLLEAWRLLTVPFVHPKDARLAVGCRSPFHFRHEFRSRFGLEPGQVPRSGRPGRPPSRPRPSKWSE
jgi:AraC-like DNA-binding protein